MASTSSDDDSGHFVPPSNSKQSSSAMLQVIGVAGDIGDFTEENHADAESTTNGCFHCPPVRIGKSFLFWGSSPLGKKFPRICLVGPDWRLMSAMYFMIVSFSSAFIGYLM
jgi:hypothetical protein